MKALTILTAIFLLGCSTSRLIREDTLYITRAYVGDFLSENPQKQGCTIYTSKDIFHLLKDQPKIPSSARCYIQLKAFMLPGSGSKMWKAYFTWDGTDNLYELRQNWITRELL